MKTLTRKLLAGATAAGLVLGVTGVADADDISNNLDTTVDAVAEVMALNVGGGNGTTQLYVVPQNNDGKNGCNLTGGTTLTVSVSSSNTAVAEVSPPSVTFTSCGDRRTLTVTPISQGSATVSVAQTANNSGGSFNLAPASFTVDVAGPANTAPQVSVNGVEGGASYNKGSVPAATCQVTDAEDGNSSFAATLSAVTGPYASDGIGSQTASCSYTDGGGLTVSGSKTYNVVDASAPTIGHTLYPSTPDGNGGWYKSDVTLTWNVSEPESPNSLSKTGCVDQNITADQLDTAYSCAATSAGGSTAAVTVSIKRDATAPTVTPASVVNSVWRNTNLSQTFSASDGGSGLADASDASFTLTASAESADPATPTVATKTVTDVAGNGTTRTVSALIDLTKPASSVSGVTPGAVYVTAPTVSCIGTDQLSGIASHGTVSGNTTDAGVKSVTCNGAVDNAGNVQTTASSAVSYTLAPMGSFNGNFDGAQVLKVKPNQAIPLKWAFNDGTTNLALLSPNGTTISSVSSTRCTAAEGADGSEVATELAAGASGLQLLPDNSYQINWKATSTIGCRALTVTMGLTAGGNVSRTILVNIVK